VREKHRLVIAYIATVVNRHKKPMTAVFAAVMALVSAYVLVTPRKYEARMRVLTPIDRKVDLLTRLSEQLGVVVEPFTHVSSSSL